MCFLKKFKNKNMIYNYLLVLIISNKTTIYLPFVLNLLLLLRQIPFNDKKLRTNPIFLLTC